MIEKEKLMYKILGKISDANMPINEEWGQG